MICPPVSIALFYLLLIVVGLLGAIFAGPTWLRVLSAMLAVYSLLCFLVTRSWLSFMALWLLRGDRELDARAPSDGQSSEGQPRSPPAVSHALGRRSLVATASLLLVMPAGLYLVAAWAVGWMDGSSPAVVTCFDPSATDELSAERIVAAVAMAVFGAGFLFVVPGVLGTFALRRFSATRSCPHAWSLVVNSAALILVCLVLRHTTGVTRWPLVFAWVTWSAVLFGLAWQSGRLLDELRLVWKRYGSGLVVGAVAILMSIVVFFPEQFVQCFNEDGTETRELARSLGEHFLPHWELETREMAAWDPGSDDYLPRGRMGTVVVNPSLINSYWTFALQTLLGDGELATRLPYWIWWAAIFAVGYRMICGNNETDGWLGQSAAVPQEARQSGASLRSPTSHPSLPAQPIGGHPAAAVPLALTIVLSGLLFTFYVGYNPYMADLANPGVPDALFTLLLLLGFDCLRRQDRAGWVATMTLASLVLYAGLVLAVLMLVSVWLFRPIQRRETLRWAVRAVAAFSGVAGFYCIYGAADGSLPCWIDTLDVEYLNDYLAAVPRWKSGPLFFGYFLLGCGGIVAVGLVWALRRDPWQRCVATTTLLYLAVVLGSGFKNLHYLGPLLPIPVILFLMPPSSGRRRTGWHCPAAAVSVVICIGLCWPTARQTFTLNRQLARKTTVTTDDYATAVQWARIRYRLKQQGLAPWDFDQHTWAGYAELDASMACPRPFVLSDGPPPPDYLAVYAHVNPQTGAAIVLYAQDADRRLKRLAEQRPLRPLDRYPPILRPLADGPFSPHNNALEDVFRLR